MTVSLAITLTVIACGAVHVALEYCKYRRQMRAIAEQERREVDQIMRFIDDDARVRRAAYRAQVSTVRRHERSRWN